MVWASIGRWLADEDGLEMVEWAVVGSAIIITAALAFTPLGQAVATVMNNIAGAVNTVTGS